MKPLIGTLAVAFTHLFLILLFGIRVEGFDSDTKNTFITVYTILSALILINAILVFKINNKKLIRVCYWLSCIPGCLFIVFTKYQGREPGGFNIFPDNQLELGLVLPIIIAFIQIMIFFGLLSELRFLPKGKR